MLWRRKTADTLLTGKQLSDMLILRSIILDTSLGGQAGPKRLFSLSRHNKINPILPFDPNEIVNQLEKDEGKKQNSVAKKAQGRIKHIRNPLKGTINSSFPNDNQNDENKVNNSNENLKSGYWSSFVFVLRKGLETGFITLSSLLILVLGGVAYHKLYKWNVLTKMKDSFNTKDSLLLTKHDFDHRLSEEGLWAERPNQSLIDDIVSGKIKGKYYLLLGEKGTGKASTVVESIRRVDGNDCVVVDCSSDVELMRLRLGTALNFEFFEDYIGSLFSMKGPREATPILDIERAFIKMETILLERKRVTNKPLIMVFNNSHLIDSSLVQLLQQRAESFSSSGLMTMLFISEDYWLFEKMRTLGTRMQVINFEDTHLAEATKILKCARTKYFDEALTDNACAEVFHLIGGRPQHLNHIASQKDMLHAAYELISSEKRWFLNNCTLLGKDMDDDVNDYGKFATSATLLMKALVDLDCEARGKDSNNLVDVEYLPNLPLWRAKQIMTRADFIEQLDRMNIFTIGTNCKVKADSVPMMRAFHEIAADSEFDALLKESLERVSEIESIQRTRELLLKTIHNGGEIALNRDPTTGAFILKENQKSEKK